MWHPEQNSYKYTFFWEGDERRVFKRFDKSNFVKVLKKQQNKKSYSNVNTIFIKAFQIKVWGMTTLLLYLLRVFFFKKKYSVHTELK